jgi:FkbM family methyltransferase
MSNESLKRLSKVVAFNEGYRRKWAQFFDRTTASQRKDAIAELLVGMDCESQEIANYHVEYMKVCVPSRILGSIFVSADELADLAAPLSRARLVDNGVIGVDVDKLSQLKRELELEEEPLAELLVHCGLHFIDRSALGRLRGGVIIDGGAYIGDSAQVFSLYHSPERIIAFEPNSLNYARLVARKERKLPGFDIIEPVCSALGRNPGARTLWGEGVGASFIKKIGLGVSAEGVEVDSIDNYVATNGIEAVSLIKLDIEGNEYEAIRGALDTIKAHNPIVAVSIYHTPRDFFGVKKLIDGLRCGYRFEIRKMTYDLVKEVVLLAVPTDCGPSSSA